MTDGERTASVKELRKFAEKYDGWNDPSLWDDAIGLRINYEAGGVELHLKGGDVQVYDHLLFKKISNTVNLMKMTGHLADCVRYWLDSQFDNSLELSHLLTEAGKELCEKAISLMKRFNSGYGCTDDGKSRAILQLDEIPLRILAKWVISGALDAVGSGYMEFHPAGLWNDDLGTLEFFSTLSIKNLLGNVDDYKSSYIGTNPEVAAHWKHNGNLPPPMIDSGEMGPVDTGMWKPGSYVENNLISVQTYTTGSK